MVRWIYSDTNNSLKLTGGTPTDTFCLGGSGGAQGPLLAPIIGAYGARVSILRLPNQEYNFKLRFLRAEKELCKILPDLAFSAKGIISFSRVFANSVSARRKLYPKLNLNELSRGFG